MKVNVLTTWRIGIFLLLATLVWELSITNRRLSEIKNELPTPVEIEGIETRLDQIQEGVSDLWVLTNELVK